MPDCAMSASRPRVLRETVLPPVLGPLMMSCRVSGGRTTVSGTGVLAASLLSSVRGAHAKFQERMTGGGEGELLREDRADAVEVDWRSGRGRSGIRPRRGCGAEVDRVGVLAERAGHGDENAMNLGLLFIEETDQLVVLLDGVEGFDEDGLRRRRTSRE